MASQIDTNPKTPRAAKPSRSPKAASRKAKASSIAPAKQDGWAKAEADVVASLKGGASNQAAVAGQAYPFSGEASAAVPVPNGLPDKAYDGLFVGAGGQAYQAGTQLDEVPPFVPSSGKVSDETVVFVNGVGNDKAGSTGDSQAVADEMKTKVVLCHNATEGHVADIAQAIADYFDKGDNKAVDAMAAMIYDRLQAGEPIHLAAHSQGCLILSRALKHTEERLMTEDGLTKLQAQAKMGVIKVETFASPAPWFPDGPQYVHYLDGKDVATWVGLNRFFGTHPGHDAILEHFKGSKALSPHDLHNYLNHWIPFDRARKGESGEKNYITVGHCTDWDKEQFAKAFGARPA